MSDWYRQLKWFIVWSVLQSWVWSLPHVSVKPNGLVKDVSGMQPEPDWPSFSGLWFKTSLGISLIITMAQMVQHGTEISQRDVFGSHVLHIQTDMSCVFSIKSLCWMMLYQGSIDPLTSIWYVNGTCSSLCWLVELLCSCLAVSTPSCVWVLRNHYFDLI